MPSNDDYRQSIGAMMVEIGRDVQGLGSKMKDVAGSSGGLGMLTKTFGEMAKTLVGPVGVAAGLYGVAKAIENVAASSVQIQAFSRNTGIATDNIRSMQYQAERMGMSVAEASQSIGTIGGKLQNLAAFREGSELWKSLSMAEGGANFARRLLQLEEAGNRMGTIAEIIKTFNAQTTRGKIAMAEYFGVSIDYLERLTVDQGRQSRINEADARRWLENWVDVSWSFKELWESMAGVAVSKLKDISHAIDTDHPFQTIFGAGLPGVYKKVWGDTPTPTREDLPAWVNDIALGATKELEYHGEGGPMAPRTPKIPWDTREGILMKGADSSRPGHRYGDAGGPDYGPMAPSGSGPSMLERARGWLQNLEVDSNKTLHDIADILSRMFDVTNAGSSGGAGGSGDTERQRIAAALGMKTGGGADPGSLKLGGRGGNVDMKGGEKNEKTGYYYPGTSTSLGGVVGSASASRGPGGHQGDDFMMPQGSPLYATKEGTVEHYGTDNFGQKTMRIRHPDGSTTSYLHMSEREIPIGTKVAGGQVIGKSGTANGVPHLHIEMRNPQGQLLEPSTTLGVPRQSGPRTPTDASVAGGVKGSWFNDHRTVSGADASKVAGIALPSYATMGKEFDVTGPDGRTMRLPQIDFGPHPRTGRGIDFSKPAADAMGYDPTNKSFTYSLVDEGKKIDRAQGGSGPGSGSINASVEFMNVPPNVKTNADTEGGIFKKVQISKTKQAGTYKPGGWDHTSMGYE